jgi:CubicO group peptidase (beta-lactamase class C family)
MVEGHVAAGFEEVRTEFERNFSRRAEIGAACAAYVRGEKVVDLWGGYRDGSRTQPWREDTLVLVYSTSKGISATAMALARSRGLIDYDERVATYWPEFAQNGKGEITVRQLLAHEAGLCAIEERLNSWILADHDRMASILARQRPAWKPGTRHGYHVLSIGWYESELIRRVDPGRRTLGRFFAEEIAAPLGLEIYFGLPGDVSADRMASIKEPRVRTTLRHVGDLPAPMVRAFLSPRSLTARAFRNPRMRGVASLDLPKYRRLEIPGGGAIAQVRDIARLYSDFATGSPELGVSAETLSLLAEPAHVPSGGAMDLVLHDSIAFSLGFAKPSPGSSFGRSPRAYGHPGAGGSFAFADPDEGVAFAYAMNRMGFRLYDDPREVALRDALYRCLDRVAV